MFHNMKIKREKIKEEVEEGDSCQSTHLLIQSRAVVKCCRPSVCCSRSSTHCSSVTDIAVRSLALLQLVRRTPFTLRHT